MSEKTKKLLTNVALVLVCLACALRWLYIGLIASRPTVYLFDCIVGLMWTGWGCKELDTAWYLNNF